MNGYRRGFLMLLDALYIFILLSLMSLLFVFVTVRAEDNVNDVRTSALNGHDISTHLGSTLGNFKLTGYCGCAK